MKPRLSNSWKKQRHIFKVNLQVTFDRQLTNNIALIWQFLREKIYLEKYICIIIVLFMYLLYFLYFHMRLYYFHLFKFSLREKFPNTDLFLVLIFLYSDWIQENTDQE